MSSVTENLLEERTYYKPFEYPWAFDYYIIQNQLHWLPEDVPMHCLLYTSPSPRD